MKRLGSLIAVMAGLLVTAALANAERIEPRLLATRRCPWCPQSPAASSAYDQPRRTVHRLQLTYTGLQGTVTQAHIHVAQPSVNGSIVIWLCQTGAT